MNQRRLLHDPSGLHFIPVEYLNIGKIHIGTGQDLDPTQYVIDEDDLLHEFSLDALVEAFSQQDRNDLLQHVSNIRSAGMVRKVQNLIRDRSRKLIPHAHRRIRVSSGIAKLYRE